MDQLTGTSVFSEEYDKNLPSRLFPDYRHSFKQLNIGIIKNRVQVHEGCFTRIKAALSVVDGKPDKITIRELIFSKVSKLRVVDNESCKAENSQLFYILQLFNLNSH